MPEIDGPPLYNPEPKGNWPHSFTGGYVSIWLNRLHKWGRF